MTAEIYDMARWRMAIVMRDREGWVAFLATRVRGAPRTAHESSFADLTDALAYARGLSQRFGCPFADLSDQRAANGGSSDGKQ